MIELIHDRPESLRLHANTNPATMPTSSAEKNSDSKSE